MQASRAAVLIFAAFFCGELPAAEITETEWRLYKHEGRPIAHQDAAFHQTLNFSPDGAVRGRAGCNQFKGKYVIHGESLSFTQLENLRRECPGGLPRETTYLDKLRQVATFEREDDHLVLKSGDDTPLLEYKAGERTD